MIACNTASATALPALSRVSPVPVIGAVEPGARSAVAATRRRHIGVIGTLATVASTAYERALAALAPDLVVTALACPLLVPLAEEGWTDDPIARAVAERYLSELFVRDPEIDTLVLGCTHYPLLRRVLGATAQALSGRDVAVVDSATAMAESARDQMEAGGEASPRPPAPRSEGRGRLVCYATDTSRLAELGPRFLGEPLDAFELVDL
jgi:glutamate racemase